MTNAYVKPFALLTKPKKNLTTWWSLWKPNTKQARGNLERCSNGTASYPSPWRKLPNSVHRFDLKKPLRNLSCQSAKSLVAECRWRAKVPASHLQIVPRSLVIETSINGNFRILYMVSTPINRFLTWPLILGRSKRYTIRHRIPRPLRWWLHLKEIWSRSETLQWKHLCLYGIWDSIYIYTLIHIYIHTYTRLSKFYDLYVIVCINYVCVLLYDVLL